MASTACEHSVVDASTEAVLGFLRHKFTTIGVQVASGSETQFYMPSGTQASQHACLGSQVQAMYTVISLVCSQQPASLHMQQDV